MPSLVGPTVSVAAMSPSLPVTPGSVNPGAPIHCRPRAGQSFAGPTA